MKRSCAIKIIATAASAALLASAANAQQTISRAGSQAATKGPAAWFSGEVRVDPLFAAREPSNYSAAYVTFEPGARSAWHTHPAGQQLIVTQGVGLTQEWDGPIVEIRAGDVVWCPPGVKHWHGASASTSMTHIALTGMVGGKNVEWLEKVSDAGGTAKSAAQETSMASEQKLSSKQQAIALTAAAMATGDMAQLNTALNQGLDAGLTISDAKEILVQLYAYAGFPRSLNALGELMKVLDSRVHRGIKDAAGREAGPVPVGKELLAVGTANQTKLSGGPVKGPLFDFAPAIDEYLKTHLFGDIFARDNFDWQSREVATVAALASMPGVESQLQSHVRISMNMGLTAPQLRHLADLLAERNHADAARRVRAALDKQPGT
jgi:4-carboxymuconolactone decarboxylase